MENKPVKVRAVQLQDKSTSDAITGGKRGEKVIEDKEAVEVYLDKMISQPPADNRT